MMHDDRGMVKRPLTRGQLLEQMEAATATGADQFTYEERALVLALASEIAADREDPVLVFSVGFDLGYWMGRREE